VSRTGRAAVAIVLTLFTVGLGHPALLTSHADPLAWPTPAGITPTSSILLPQDFDFGTFDRQDAPLDLYGNEVADAIATYKLDPTGVLYEEHSPNTEIPVLGVPIG
jgi:hypothetical protein